MLQIFRNLFSIRDLRRRILFTLMIIAIYRIGSHIPCPFVDVENLQDAFSAEGAMGGLFGAADLFTGGNFSRMSVMALGIMPYISASIILQLMMVVVPRLEKLAKEGDAGRKKITQYTRYGTVLLSAVQGFGLGLFIMQDPDVIMSFMRQTPVLFLFTTVIAVTAGTTFLMWLGEKITEKGVGNGISMIIALGIMAAYPSNVLATYTSVRLEAVTPFAVLSIAVLMVVAAILIVLVQEGARKIPIQHAKMVVGRKMQQSQTNYLPLKVNTAGVMPVIFAMAILTLPTTIFGWIGAQPGTGLGFIGELFSMTSRYNLYDLFGLERGAIFNLLKAANLYTLVYAVLVAFFCFFYTAIVFNPQDVADNLRRVGAFVPGYRPGKQTADYIDKVMTRITLVGAVFLVTVSVMPQLVMAGFDIPFVLADFAGGTGLIIVVAVTLDTMKQVESRMLMRHYDGFRSRRQQGGGQRWAKKPSPR